MSNPSEKIIRHNNVNIFAEHFGQADDPAVLLIAGATVSMLYWDEAFCTRLADKGFYVIRYDNRDTGKSTHYEPGTTPYNIVDLTDDAILVLEAYDIEKANVLGMSLGGLIAQIASLKYPARVNTLTLLATGPWANSDPDIPEMDQRILDFQDRAETIDWTNEDAVVNYMVESAQLMSGQKPFDEKHAASFYRAEFKRAANYKSTFNHGAVQGGEQYYNRLNEIKQPTLIIHGTEDKIWHYKQAEFMLDKIKGARLIALQGIGHELHPDDYETIIDGVAGLALS